MNTPSHAYDPKQSTSPSSVPSQPHLPIHAERIYFGHRRSEGTCEVTVTKTIAAATGDSALENAPACPLPLRLDLRNHSPTGFAWGYAGSGPAQLALALLADALGDDELALQHYQEFKRRVVAGWGAAWQLTATEIQRFVVQEQFHGMASC